MPMYVFFCEQCENEFEQLKSMGENESNCPVCGEISKKNEISQITAIVKGGNKRSIDHIIGEDADKKWQKIHDDKEKRQRQVHGNVSEEQMKVLEAQRISGLTKRQNDVYVELDKAKKEAGITQGDELKHALGFKSKR